MKLFSTTDIASSIRKAHGEFTHVLVNRGYTTIKPAFFRSILIADLPVYQWAWWKPAMKSQLEKWRKGGGVLLDESPESNRAGPIDVLVFVECPLTMDRIVKSYENVAEYGVIPVPHTWKVHEQAIDLKTPTENVLMRLWGICGGKRMSDAELGVEAGIPKHHAMYMRASFKPTEEWEIKPRLAPEHPGLLPAWEWVGRGRHASKSEIVEAGHKIAIKEMARLGNISLTRTQVYPQQEPNWERLAGKRQRAIENLRSVQSLVKSLPDHLQA